MKRTALLLASTALAVLLASGAVWADTFRVTNTKDPGTGSLRAAINEANARPDADAITFAPGVRGDSGLKKALPSLRGEVEIRGPGPSRLTVRRSAPEAFRVFSVAEGAALTISGLKVPNGLAPSSGPQMTGGGIHVELGALSVENCSFSTNGTPADVGGAISTEGGEVTVVGSTFSNNEAALGGAVSNYLGGRTGDRVGGRLTVRNSAFSRNEGTGGGVIGSVFDGVLTVVNSDFSENAATKNGATWISEDVESTVEGSTLSRNTATKGGAIFSFGELAVRNSTFSVNVARSYGGGLYKQFGHDSPSLVSVEGSTFANNSAARAGGGLYHRGSSNFFLRMTIAAGNEAPESPDVSGAFSSGGYNLIRDPSGTTGFGATDLTNTRAGLDPQGLQDNGGLTKTIALVQSGPAVDAVQEGCPPPATDQRGVSRPRNGDGNGAALYDIEAYELSAP